MTIQQEIVFRIHKTPKGVKVMKYDGYGLADGIFTKPYTRYFYGDNAEEKAEQYAENKVEKIDRDCQIVRLGERL